MSFKCTERDGMIKLFGTSRSDEDLAKADWNKHAHKHLYSPWSTQSKKEGRRSNKEQLGERPPHLSEMGMFRLEWIRQPSSAESHSRRVGRLPVTGATRGSSSPPSAGTLFSDSALQEARGVTLQVRC